VKYYCALSFDDGYKSHLAIARVLKEMGLRATFYCITHLRYWLGKPLLNAEEVAMIREMGHEVGSHSCTHIDLTKAPLDAIEKELKASKEYLENITGKEITGFAYPFGKFNKRVIDITRRYYEYARALELGDFLLTFNVTPLNKYAIGALANIPHPIRNFKRSLDMLATLRYVAKGYGHIVLCSHEVAPLAKLTVDPIKLIAFVRHARKITNIKFVTVQELAEELWR
jgi:peptidoglycan/xylan/chitin deacetylase (PgdA/CDA1 family)